MKDYSKLKEITVRSQAELDDIPDNFTGEVFIEFGTLENAAVVSRKTSFHFVARGCSVVIVHGDSFVEARDDSTIYAYDDSIIGAVGNSTVFADGDTSVTAQGSNRIKAHGSSSVEAWSDSIVEAYSYSRVTANENTYVKAGGNCVVEAWGDSVVEAYDGCQVLVDDNSFAEAFDNSVINARGDSVVDAHDNSVVEARDNSSVTADGNVQVIDRLRDGRIQIAGNARIIRAPKTIDEYVSIYGIARNVRMGRFYKAVHKQNGRYFSDFSKNGVPYEYVIGKNARADKLNKNPQKNYGHGIHITNLSRALKFGSDWNDLAILEVEANLDKIIIPINSDGSLRCAKVKVIREVPLEECGVYGKMLYKRRNPQCDKEVK